MASSKGKITRHHFVVSYSSATPKSIEPVFAGHSLSSLSSSPPPSHHCRDFPSRAILLVLTR